MQESRLFRILYYLLDKGHTTAPGRNGGIHMLDDYVLNRSYFTDGEKQDSSKFELLKRAVIHHQVAVITYVSSYGTQSKRTIHPLKFLYKAKAWYIKAYCTDKKDFRIFKFNRIVALKILEKKFTPVDFPKTEEPQPGTYRKIILRFSKEMPEDFWLIGYLLSFGAYVEVVEPASLREILSKEAKKYMKHTKPDICCQVLRAILSLTNQQ